MTKGDKITFLILFLLVAASFLLIRSLFPASSANYALIFHGSKRVLEVPLDRDAKYEVRGDVGKMIIEVKKGRVRVSESKCPLKICVKTGWIEKEGEEIICIPNRIRVRIEGDNELDEIVR